MKIVVDSGSTKADWILFDEDNRYIEHYSTKGLNPEVLNIQDLIDRIQECQPLTDCKDTIEKIFFYGSGCGTPRSKDFMRTALMHCFDHTRKFDIKEDTFAAVYATSSDLEPAIVCINGTGSNCSYFDGEQVFQAVDSLGYMAMDDCGGVDFGREMLRAFYFKTMPEHLAKEFAEKYEMNSDVVKKNLYKLENPNAYLASFLPFLIQHKEDSFFKELIYDKIIFFVNHYIKQFEVHQRVPIHFVGSVAYLLKEEFTAVLHQNNLTIGNIIQKPLDGLIQYHKM